MPPLFQRRAFKICRVCFRWCRIALWLAVLAVVCGCGYLHHFGLPGFFKAPLQRKLAARGMGLDFTRLRWRWYRGCVADGLILSGTNTRSIWRFTAREAAIGVGWSKLPGRRLDFNSLLADHGSLSWQSRTNSSRLVVREISTEFHLSSRDRLILDDFHAEFEGVRFSLAGTLTNASALTNLLARPNRPKRDLEETLQQTAGWTRRIQCGGPARVSLLFAGDALDPSNLRSALQWGAPELRTPWGRFERAGGGLDLNRLESPGGPRRSALRLRLAEAQTQWAGLTNLLLTLQFTPPRRGATNIASRLNLRLAAADAGSSQGEELSADLAIIQSLDTGEPLSADGTAAGRRLATRWGRAETFDSVVHVRRRDPFKSAADSSWGFLAKLEPWLIQLEARAGKFHGPKLDLESASLNAQWSAPALSLDHLESRLYGGGIELGGAVDVSSREASAEGTFDFDVRRVSHLLAPSAQKWLGQFNWDEPPSVRGRIQLVLPAWTGERPAWKEVVMPTIKLSGGVSGGAGTFRGIPSTGVRASFAFTNDTWHVPYVHATRPEGSVEFSYEGNVLTHAFRFEGSGSIDPFAVLPVVPEKYHRFFPLFGFTTPPLVSGVVTGDWRNHELFQVRADVTATNLSFKGAAFDSFQSAVRWSNRWVRLTKPAVWRQGRRVTADEVEVNLNSHLLSLAAVHSNLDPLLAASLISPAFATSVQPFQFASPPELSLDGRLNTSDPSEHDLRWELSAPGVVWRKIETGPLSGRVFWVNRDVVCTNCVASPVSGPGTLSGWAVFHYTPGAGFVFALDTRLANLDLHPLVSRFTTHTNRLEGTLDGHLVITSGRTAGLAGWEGYGDARLHDGFIWEFPIFGIFSPVLDAIIPGLGQSRATEASVAFLITNSVFSSEDLDIRAPTLRMDYHGTVDLEGNVRATVEARVLRDAWLIGPILRVLLRPVTKLFEYQVTGTLSHPRNEPLYIPKIFMAPLQPFRTLRDLFTKPAK
jgi:hypothetical protein